MAVEKKVDSEDFKKINPSIFLGLGGTGKHVLLTLRKKFFEKYSLKQGLPVTEFAWIDTDEQNVGLDGKALDYTQTQVMFEKDEIVPLRVSRDQFERYMNYKNDYPHIWEWLPLSIEAQGPPKDGAKQIRPLGRLAFFANYENIVRKLKEMRSRVVDEDNVSRTHDMGFEVNVHRINVYIIFSVAGGTGSGIFLDVAYAVKEYIRNVNSIGYVVLPSVFSTDTTERIYANSYAAIKELEHYALRKDILKKDEETLLKDKESKHDFCTWYSKSDFDFKKSPIVDTPFDITYLIDNKTSEGAEINLQNKDQLLDMLSENIFLQMTGPTPLRTQIKTIQSNIHATMETSKGSWKYEMSGDDSQVIYRNYFSKKYASMGVSKIYIPTHRIKKACGLKLAIDIVGNWTKEPGEDHNINNLVQTFLYKSIGLVKNEQGKSFVTMVNKSGQRTYEASVDEWINQLRNNAIPKIEKKAPNVRKIFTDAYEQYMKENITKVGAKGGIYSDGIDTNANNVINDTRKSILDQINTILKDPNFRFYVAKKMLLLFKEKLDFIREKLEDERNKIKQNVSQKYQKAFQNTLNTYSDVERRFSYLKKTTQLKLGEILIRQLRDWMVNEVRALLLEGALKVVTEISGFVGFAREEQNDKGETIVVEEGLVKKLSDVEKILEKDILNSLCFKYDSFSKEEEEHINIGLFTADLVEKYYEIDNKKVTLEIVDIKGNEFLADQKVEMIGLIDHLQKGKISFENALEEYSFNQISMKHEQYEAIQLLYQEGKYDPDDRKRKIREFVKKGQPWIKPSKIFMGTGQESKERRIERQSLMGVYPGEGDAYIRFNQEFKKVSIEARFQQTESDPNAVYFYSEWVGFPLLYVDGLRHWHDDAYVKFLAGEEEDLHIEKYYHKYDELINIPQKEVKEYLMAYETLILGFMLGIIDIEEEKTRKTFRYSIEVEAAPGVFRPKKLGDEYFAIKRLQKDASLRENIYERIADKKRQIFTDTGKRWDYYALLKYYWDNVFPLRYTGNEANVEELRTFEFEVIEREMNLVGENIREEMKMGDYGKDEINKLIKEKLQTQKLNLDDFSKQVGDSLRRVVKY